MQVTKNKIEQAVRQYTQMFPSEYKAFLKSHRVKEHNKINEWADFKASDQMVRHLLDMPETLYFALKQSLTTEEMDWLYGKNTHFGKREGIKWFMKRFPQFKITKEF